MGDALKSKSRAFWVQVHLWLGLTLGVIGALPLLGNRLQARIDLAPVKAPARSPCDPPGTSRVFMTKSL